MLNNYKWQPKTLDIIKTLLDKGEEVFLTIGEGYPESPDEPATGDCAERADEKPRDAMEKVAVKEWEATVDGITSKLDIAFIELGAMLYVCVTTFKKEERDEAINHLRLKGIAMADLRLALAAYLQKNPELGLHMDLRIDAPLDDLMPRLRGRD